MLYIYNNNNNNEDIGQCTMCDIILNELCGSYPFLSLSSASRFPVRSDRHWLTSLSTPSTQRGKRKENEK